MEGENFSEHLAQLDAYGSRIELLYKNRKEHPTPFGGMITLFNVVILFIVTITYGSQLLKQDKPVTNFSEETIKQPEIYNMTEQIFSITFGMQDPAFNHYIDNSVYTIKVNQTNMIKVFNQQTQEYEQQWNSVDLGPYPCKKEQLKVPGSQDYYDELVGLDQMYCFEQSENKAWIGGDFSADLYGFIEFFILQCTNKTETEAKEMIAQGQKVVICKSQEEIDSLLSGGYFAAYYTDKVINPKNLDNPFSTIERDIFWPVSNKLESDMGLVREDTNVMRDVVFSYSTEQVVYGQSSQFVHLVLRFEKAKQSRYYRSYAKIEDAMAQVSGVMDFVILISSFVCLRMSKLDLSKQLSNEIFAFQSNGDISAEELQEKKTQNEDTENKLIRKLTDKLNNSRFMQYSIDNNHKTMNEDVSCNLGEDVSKSFNKAPTLARKNLQHNELLSNYIKTYKKSISNKISKSQREIQDENQYKKQISKLFKVSNSVLNLSFYEYILFYIFPCWSKISRKKRQIDYTKQHLDRHLDVLYLVNKLQEVDKLKMLLLNDDQIKLFNYLPKPTIKENDLIQKEKTKKSKQLTQSADLQGKQNESLDVSINQHGKSKNCQIEKFNMLYMDNRSEIEKASDAYSAFENLRKQSTRSSIDTKLLLMLDPKILDYFLDEGEIDSFHDNIKIESNQNASLNNSNTINSKLRSQFSVSNIKNNRKIEKLKTFSQIDQSYHYYKRPQGQLIQFSPLKNKIVPYSDSNNQLIQQKSKDVDQNEIILKLSDDSGVIEELKESIDEQSQNNKSNENNTKNKYKYQLTFNQNLSDIQSESNDPNSSDIIKNIKSDNIIPSEQQQQSPTKWKKLIPDSIFNMALQNIINK